MAAITSLDLETLLVCSIRYALGRQTYMPAEVQRIARSSPEVLGLAMLDQIARDIEHAVRTGHAGADVDAQGWLEFAAWCIETATEHRSGPVKR